MMFDPKDFDPTRYSPPDTLPRFAEACAELPRKSVIAIHGWCRTGKTHAAAWLGSKLRLKPIRLDDFNFSQRPGFNPETDAYGFDEDAMRATIKKRLTRATIIVEGVCACRVCVPDILLDLGNWDTGRSSSARQSSLTSSVGAFIGDYDGRDFTGRLGTFRCEPSGLPRSQTP